MNYGFAKVAAAIPSLKVADCTYNTQQIENLINRAEEENTEIIVFPELCICGYTCQDLFGQQMLLQQCEKSLSMLIDFTRSRKIIVIIGMPIAKGALLMNCAVALQAGKILGVVPKTYLPNHQDFNEQRWFSTPSAIDDSTIHLCAQTVPLGSNLIFHTSSATFGIEIGEDLWAPIPPSCNLALKGAEIIFNLSASNEQISKHQYLQSLISQQSARCLAGYVYSSCGFGESTQDAVFAGNAFIYENGALIAQSQRFSLDEQLIISEIDTEFLRHERYGNTIFSENIRWKNSCTHADIQCQAITHTNNFRLTRSVHPHPFVPSIRLNERCEETFSIQTEGLAKRIVHTHAQSIIVGISGGLDSTLALLVCVKTMDMLKRSRKDIIGITMPGFGTTDRTYNNAVSLMESLGITIKEISIKDACIQHFKDINHDINVHDVTYENGQARERTQILMDVANQYNGFVVGTGDLSELALGWATYNGDHMSNYGVNASVPKTFIKHIVKWVAMTQVDEKSKATLLDIIDTPISPELIPADENGNIKQKTEDLVGPYELHDFFLYYFLRKGFSPSKIYFLAQQAFITPAKPIESAMEVGVYDKETIQKWLKTFCRRFFSQQFKRSCLPDGPKVGTLSLSPRSDWRMPSDASSSDWLADFEKESAY
ncbi:MAG: NAD(+) synthase [Bacteroidaceae bacterium]|nr:NAD(+) synthase [Bacteroidaceae bacterium]